MEPCETSWAALCSENRLYVRIFLAWSLVGLSRWLLEDMLLVIRYNSSFLSIITATKVQMMSVLNECKVHTDYTHKLLPSF